MRDKNNNADDDDDDGKKLKGLQENIAEFGVDIIFGNPRYNLSARKSRTIAWHHLCGSEIRSQP